jgi:hypothetical protein
MKVGMIQSNFLPWRGYFDFIDDVDVFVIYDDVQYTRHDWRNRNRVKTVHGLKWITVPVRFHRRDEVLIRDVAIDYSQPWSRKHLKTVSIAYAKAEFMGRYYPKFSEILSAGHRRLADLNVALIKWIMGEFDIAVPLRYSWEFNPRGRKTDRIVDILEKLNADSYLLGPLGKNYVEEEKFANAHIALEYKAYDYAEYPQLHGPFESQVSVIDLLFNCGPDARKYLKSRSPNVKAV